jgi:cbb3-type cytochrome oxidase subunit 3
MTAFLIVMTIILIGTTIYTYNEFNKGDCK